MAACLENVQIPTCFWFEGGDKRNALASMVAGTLFFLGWWFMIDACAKYPSESSSGYFICGIFGTISLLMVNSVTNAQIRGDAYDGGCLGARGARGWLLIGFVMGFAAVIGSCWIMFSDFIFNNEAKHLWPGYSLFLQNLCIIVGSVIYKFGRSEDNWS